MSEYVTIEHYVNHVMDEITKRDVEQVSESLRAFGWEEVVHCRDCTAYDGEGYRCSYGRGDDPDGFCAWGERHELEAVEVWKQWSADDVTCSEES